MPSPIKICIPARYHSSAVSLELYRGHKGVSDPQARCKAGAMGRLVATLAHAGLWGIYIITPNYIIVPGDMNIYACVHTYTHTSGHAPTVTPYTSHSSHIINISKVHKSKCILQNRSHWVYRGISFIVTYCKWPQAQSLSGRENTRLWDYGHVYMDWDICPVSDSLISFGWCRNKYSCQSFLESTRIFMVGFSWMFYSGSWGVGFAWARLLLLPEYCYDLMKRLVHSYCSLMDSATALKWIVASWHLEGVR